MTEFNWAGNWCERCEWCEWCEWRSISGKLLIWEWIVNGIRIKVWIIIISIAGTVCGTVWILIKSGRPIVARSIRISKARLSWNSTSWLLIWTGISPLSVIIWLREPSACAITGTMWTCAGRSIAYCFKIK